MDIFESIIKPDLTKYKNEELLEILKKIKNEEINSNNFNRADAIKIIQEYWKTYRLDDELKCAICFELITNSNLTITQCDHYFHSSCMFISLKKNNTCPICRCTLVNSDNNSCESENLSSVDSMLNVDYMPNVIVISTINMYENSDNDSNLSINTI
jgi:hypothetical protein